MNTPTGELHFFDERQIAGIETRGNALRVYASNCVIEHRIDCDKRWLTSEYLKDPAATKAHKALIMASLGSWDFEASIYSIKGMNADSGVKLGSTIEARIQFPGQTK